jgi:hypothetical protein
MVIGGGPAGCGAGRRVRAVGRRCCPSMRWLVPVTCWRLTWSGGDAGGGSARDPG